VFLQVTPEGLGDPTFPVVYCQEFFDDGGAGGADLYVGGSFISAGGFVSNYIARWNGSSWSSVVPVAQPRS